MTDRNGDPGRTNGPSVVIVSADTMGRGDDGLGAKLLGNFLRTLVSVEPKPEAIVFYNSAVKLLGSGSPSLDALRALDDAGSSWRRPRIGAGVRSRQRSR